MIGLALALFISACSGGVAGSDPVLSEGNNPSADTPQAQAPADQEEMIDEKADMQAEATEEMIAGDDEDQAGEGIEPGSGEAASEEIDEDGRSAAEQDAAADERSAQASPAYFTAVLTDATSGESFRIEDYRGKVVLLETLAMWCSNCYRQQSEVKLLHEKLGPRTDFISLGLDIDPNENLADLKNYVEDNEFDWLYAVAPLDVARELGQLYSAQFLNPPSTPMLIIDRQGNVHTLPFGIKSADQLLEALVPFLDEG
jgi:hypothetical protein